MITRRPPPPSDSRDRIIDAAARLFGEHGVAGTTTRRVAEVAGVNEVTIFRLFGSKTALLEEVTRTQVGAAPVAPLPARPAEPLREVTVWCAARLAWLRGSPDVARRCFTEARAHPELVCDVPEQVAQGAAELRAYAERLVQAGRAPADADVVAASAMLVSTMLSDALGRADLPGVFPGSEEEAPERYARAFLAVLCRDGGMTGR